MTKGGNDVWSVWSTFGVGVVVSDSQQRGFLGCVGGVPVLSFRPGYRLFEQRTKLDEGLTPVFQIGVGHRRQFALAHTTFKSKGWGRRGHHNLATPGVHGHQVMKGGHNAGSTRVVDLVLKSVPLYLVATRFLSQNEMVRPI